MKALLEFDYPAQTCSGIEYRHHSEKITGSQEDLDFHVDLLKKYGSMKNIKVTPLTKGKC